MDFLLKKKAGRKIPARSKLLRTGTCYGVGVGGCVPAGQVAPAGQTSAVGPVPPAAGRVVAVPMDAPGAGAGVQPLPSHVASNSAEKLGEAVMLTVTQFCVVVRWQSAGPKPVPGVVVMPRWNVRRQSGAPVPPFARLRYIQPAFGAAVLGFDAVIPGGNGRL